MLLLRECADRGPGRGQRPSAEKGAHGSGRHAVWKDTWVCTDDTEVLGPSEDEKLWENVSGAWRGESLGAQLCRQRGERRLGLHPRAGERNGEADLGPNGPPPSPPHCGFRAFCPAHGLNPVPEAHLEVTHHGVKAPALGLGDAPQTAEHEAWVALAATTHRFWQDMPEKPGWQVAGHSLAQRVYLLLGGQVRAGGGRSRREKSRGQDREKGTKSVRRPAFRGPPARGFCPIQTSRK